MATSGVDLDEARRLVVERGLARAAFEHLTVDAFLTLPFEALGPTKALLKRFFSADAWGRTTTTPWPPPSARARGRGGATSTPTSSSTTGGSTAASACG